MEVKSVGEELSAQTKAPSLVARATRPIATVYGPAGAAAFTAPA